MSNFDIKSGIGDTNSSNLQDYNLSLVTAPTLSIVSKTEAKSYLKIGSDTTDDSLVDDLILAATGMIEREAGGVALCTQTWKQTQQGGCKQIKLLRQPVRGVPTVSYFDDFDDVTSTNITYTSEFRVINPNKLVHSDGWFDEGREGDGYQITYECGLFTASTYTNSKDPRLNVYKTAILRTIAWLYEQREEGINEINEGNWTVKYSQGLPEGIKRLIMPVHTGEGLI